MLRAIEGKIVKALFMFHSCHVATLCTTCGRLYGVVLQVPETAQQDIGVSNDKSITSVRPGSY